MPDGYMNPADLAHDQTATKTAREVSKIQFPYFDLGESINVARIMRDKGGAAPLSRDQLAAALGMKVSSGAFGAKIQAARMFGICEAVGDKTRITQLGFEAIDSDEARARAARAQAFLSVPLYRRTYDEFRNRQLPPRPHGLEQAFISFGVAEKRKSNARWAFDRSAKQAGFFDNGEDRLIAPVVTSYQLEDAALEPSVAPERSTSHADPASARREPSVSLHPFIEGMLQTLPEPHSEWSIAERIKWLRAAASIFGVLYTSDDKDDIEVNSRPL